MSSENSVFLEQEKTSTALLNDILDQLKRIPNTTAVVNSINHLNAICVPMIGANKLAQQANGVSGFVPAPSITEAGKFLRGDGTWQPVITHIDPLKTESLVYPTNIANATGYPFVQPSDDTSGTVGTLKYNKNLRFGRHEVTMSNDRPIYTLLGLKQDEKSVDVGIEFINSSSSGGSTILFANLSNSNIKVKMPQVDGTLLTDSGFTVNGPVTMNSNFTTNGFVHINATNAAEWNHGIRIQSSVDGHALIGLGVSASNSTVNDSWFIRSDKSTGNNTFSIAYGGIVGSKYGSLWTNTDGNWSMTNKLAVSSSITSPKIISSYFSIDDKYATFIGYNPYTDRDNTLTHWTYHPQIAFSYSTSPDNDIISQVNLIDYRQSRFYMDALLVEPLSDASVPYEGGEIQLWARRPYSYGNIIIDNYNGVCRIWNSNDESSMLQIDSTKNNAYKDGSLIRAEKFAVNAYSYMAVNGYIHLTISSNGINLHADGLGPNQVKHIDASVPMSSTAASTPVGEGNRYYRPIIISSTAPSQSDGRAGDVWIQYS